MTPPPASLRMLVCAVALAGLARQAPAQDKWTYKVVKYVAHQERARYQGKQVLALGVEPLEGGRTLELIVANKDMNRQEYDPVPQAADTVRYLKPGDVIKIELDNGKPQPLVRSVKRYKLKPGEDEPNTYVYENSFPKNDGRNSYTAVVLSRYDQQTTVAVQQRRDKEGGMASDPEIISTIEKLKPGEMVVAEVKEGRTPVLTGIDRYVAPQKGKFVKLEEGDVEGQKGMVATLEREGKTVTAAVPGKLQNKRWVNDSKVLAEARKLKPNSEVVYRAREEGKTLWLKDIEPAPKADESASASASRGGRDAAAAPRDAKGDTRKNERRREPAPEK